MTKLGVPKKGAVARLRKLYNERRESTLTSIREKREEALKNKKQDEKPTKKIAKDSRDLESL